ncbi:MAG: hypothetical protein JXA36_06530 [Coriobacteriia bacterium]|nr:hypothetical protein [Coriobacteriia bacterium]
MLRRIVIAGLVFVMSVAVIGCNGDEITLDTGEVGSGTAPTVDASALLTAADVEAVSGLTGLRVVAYNPAVGAGGDVNIATESGQLVVMMIVEGPETWDAWLTDGYTVSEPVTPPVGDESFIGPNPDISSTTYIFGFRKGDVAIALDTYFDANGETILSIDQLRELAVVIDGRL